MSLDTKLRATSPTALSEARSLLHKAVQLLTKAARANLDSEPDDSHSNLGWDRENKRFCSHPLPTENGPVTAALSMSPLRVELVRGETVIVTGPIVGESYRAICNWFDDQLSKYGLQPASDIDLPYELPTDVAAVEKFDSDRLRAELGTLSAWFNLASLVLEGFANDNSKLKPGPVRCWPHHFDIATYVQLEEGNFESAKGIGIGMSPGDESYDQPYFYINPWPHMDPQKLPDAPVPGHWHTQDFVGAIATGGEVLTATGAETAMQSFVRTSFEIGRAHLGV